MTKDQREHSVLAENPGEDTHHRADAGQDGAGEDAQGFLLLSVFSGGVLPPGIIQGDGGRQITPPPGIGQGDGGRQIKGFENMPPA